MQQERKFTLWFDEIRVEDVPSVGGKNASLGEMYQDLTYKWVKIPNGFATTSGAYWHLLEAAGILDKLKEAVAGLDKKSNVQELAEKGKRARELILGAKIPEDLWGMLPACTRTCVHATSDGPGSWAAATSAARGKSSNQRSMGCPARLAIALHRSPSWRCHELPIKIISASGSTRFHFAYLAS